MNFNKEDTLTDKNGLPLTQKPESGNNSTSTSTTAPGGGEEESESERRTIRCKKIALDSEDLAADTSERSFQKQPINNFAERMFEKMGYTESTGIGSSKSNQLKNPIQFKPRPEGLGVGAIPKKEIIDKIKRGDIVTGHDLISKDTSNYYYIGQKREELKESDKVTEGVKVFIQEGSYKGLQGVFLGVKDTGRYAIVQLAINQTNVSVPLRFLIKASKVTGIVNSNPQKVKKVDSAHQEVLIKRKRKKKRLEWIVPGIRLKIVSQKYEGGKYFLSKGEVTDMRDLCSFEFLTEGGFILDDLKEK